MSIKRNIIANYLGQFYVALIGLLLVPVYVKYMGAEAYGLVGFFAMLQALFFLLDMGLTPTMARETARFQGGASDAISLRRLVRTLEGFFLVIGLVGAVAIILSSDMIATQWLKANELPGYEIKNSLVLMALIIALRWMGGLYRSAITGFERLVWLNVVNIIIATFRFVIIVPILIYVDSTPTVFFAYQLIITVVEFIIFFMKTYKLLPSVDVLSVNWSWAPLQKSLKFSLTVALAGIVWVGVTQTDKLILSGMISLADYGYYMLAVLLASGLMIVSKPISGAILPRMTKLNAECNYTGLFHLYRNATQGVAIVSIPIALVLSIFAEQVLFAWSGNAQIAHKAAPVLFLYALGNCIMVFSAFPYYIQYAKGDLKLYLIANMLLGMFFIPLIYYSVEKFGMVGAGYAWIIINGLFFLLYVPIVHYRFDTGLHMKWLLVDIGFVGAPPFILLIVINELIIVWPSDRLMLSAFLLVILASAMLIASIGSSKVRNTVRNLIEKKF